MKNLYLLDEGGVQATEKSELSNKMRTEETDG